MSLCTEPVERIAGNALPALGRIMIVAFHAPPRGGIASIRVVKLAKYLARLGWEITILTSRPMPDEPLDASLKAELPESVQVVELPFPDIQRRLSKIFRKQPTLRRWLQNLFIPDDKLPWALNGLFWLLLNPQKTNAILSTSPTPASHFLGYLLSRQNPQAVWLTDLRDEWSLNPYASQHPWPRFWNALLERWIFQRVDYIGVVNDALRDKYSRVLAPKMSRKLVVLPNGFDTEQIAAIRSRIGDWEPSERLVFAYAGSFYGDRTPEVFFSALKKLFDEGVIPAETVAIHFYGKTKGYKLAYPGLEFKWGGIIPYDDVLEALGQADVLLHISSAPDAHGGKTFDYLGLEKPILALIHRASELEKLLSPTGLATVAQYNSVDDVATAIKSLYEQWRVGQLTSQANRDYIYQHTRENLASRIHTLLIKKPSRPKIYHLHARQPSLEPNKGDKINQISFMEALSRFADVYYNEQLFVPDAPNYGLTAKKIKPPRGKYDLYIVRNNAEIFQACPHPKLWVASPYDRIAFETAEAVLTLTESWKDRLEQFHTPGADPHQAAASLFDNNFPPDMAKPRKVINIKQVVSPHFFDLPDEERIRHYKSLFGDGLIVAFFGRINIKSYPYAFMRCLPALEQAIGQLKVVFAGQIQDMNLEFATRTGYTPEGFDKIDLAKVVNPPEIPFMEMPSAIRACQVILANEQPEADWAGSIKPMEAMVCGVPFLTRRRPVRIEQLGANYPLYYETDEELMSHMLQLANNSAFYRHVQDYLLERAQAFTIDKMAGYLENQLMPFIRN